MEVREEILNNLKIKKRTSRELCKKMHIKGEEKRAAFFSELKRLEEEGLIYKDEKEFYQEFNEQRLGKVQGIVHVNNAGLGFIKIEKEGKKRKFILKQNELNGALDGDMVVITDIHKGGHSFLKGKVEKVIKRANHTIFEYIGEGTFIPYNSYGNIKVLCPKETLDKLVEGSIVLMTIDNNTNDKQKDKYFGKVKRIIGHKDDPDASMKAIAESKGFYLNFSKKAMEELDRIPKEVKEEEIEGRKDLRRERIFTIDGKDTKDMDDAVGIKKDGDNYIITVSIADVSHYIKKGSALDKEARERGTSLYMADSVVPMLPHKLSNGICSLNPEVERLATSCVMEIDQEGNIINYDIFKSIIKSRKQMTYKNVNKILEENIIPEGYEPFASTLKQMGDLAKILRKNKINRGYIDFDIDESKIIVDETGKAIDVKLRERGTGEKLIEDFMIAANESVATYIYNMDLPFVYRIHGEPSEDKINNFMKFISILGYKIRSNRKEITPKSMQEMLDQLKDKEEYPILSSILLRSMQKAIYDKNNIGHFGLASKCYTHFTSPIRRYPDLIVHRLLNEYIFLNNINEETINKYDYKLKDITAHSSERERAAVECEREVDDMKKAEYMQDHIGEEYEGMISSVMPFGMFVELPNLVEGLVHIDDLEGDHYMYNEETFSIVGNKDKRGYRLGDKVTIKVKSANKEAKTVDFTIKK